MNIHSAPDELIEELDRGMILAVPLHMIPELQQFDMTHVYRQITSRPECIQGAWREQVARCTSYNCALYAVRPVTYAGRKAKKTTNSATI